MRLIATKPLTYGTRQLVAGDGFDAAPRHGRLLIAIKKAREPSPRVPVKSEPPPEPAAEIVAAAAAAAAAAVVQPQPSTAEDGVEVTDGAGTTAGGAPDAEPSSRLTRTPRRSGSC